MRELKFRAWDVKERTMHKAGFLIDSDGAIYDNTLCDGEIQSYSFGSGKLILMQYTGLKDKDGKEIYEGDFLEGSESGEFGSTLSTWIDVVVWDKEKAGFICMDICEGETLDLDQAMTDKVVGNIYTHPEWLERIKEEFDALRSDTK